MPADKQLTVGIVGGSIAAGQGAEDAPSWADRLETYLTEIYGRVAHINITVNNGAVPGSTSHYMSGCVNLHVPANADIVVVDYTVNDEALVDPNMNNPHRSGMSSTEPCHLALNRPCRCCHPDSIKSRGCSHADHTGLQSKQMSTYMREPFIHQSILL